MSLCDEPFRVRSRRLQLIDESSGVLIKVPPPLGHEDIAGGSQSVFHSSPG